MWELVLREIVRDSYAIDFLCRDGMVVVTEDSRAEFRGWGTGRPLLRRFLRLLLLLRCRLGKGPK